MSCNHSRTEINGTCASCLHEMKEGREAPCDTCVHRNTQCNWEQKEE
jgi:hypothetical protein